MNKNLLDYKLLLEYYKDNNYFDRYISVKEDNIILDNNILNILDNVNEFIYIIPFSKYKDMTDEKDKEIEKLKNIINKFGKWVDKEIEANHLDEFTLEIVKQYFGFLKFENEFKKGE